MVNQSDAPFRILTHRYGATLSYTQMLWPSRLLNEQDYLEFHLRDLQAGPRPVVVQLVGNDAEILVRASKNIQGSCDGIGIFSSYSDSRWCLMSQI